MAGGLGFSWVLRGVLLGFLDAFLPYEASGSPGVGGLCIEAISRIFLNFSLSLPWMDSKKLSVSSTHARDVVRTRLDDLRDRACAHAQRQGWTKASRPASRVVSKADCTTATAHPPERVLPLDDIERQLQEHPMIRWLLKTTNVAPQDEAQSAKRKLAQVYQCILQLTGCDGKDGRRCSLGAKPAPMATDSPAPSPAAPNSPTPVDPVAAAFADLETLLSPPTDQPTTLASASASSCDCGAAPAFLEVCPRREGWACTRCGGVRRAFVSDENPYRYFAEDRFSGKADPTHWSVLLVEEEADPWWEVEALRAFAFGGAATDAHAAWVYDSILSFKAGGGRQWRRCPSNRPPPSRSLPAPPLALVRALTGGQTNFDRMEWESFGVMRGALRPEVGVQTEDGAWYQPVPRQVPNRWALAAAAWIVCESPRLVTHREVGGSTGTGPETVPPPPPPHPCPWCREAFHVRKALRHHERTCPGRSR